MSIQGDQVYAHLLFRSTTPAPNEKVRSFLEGMARHGEEPDNTPPRSMTDPDEYRQKPESVRNSIRSPQRGPIYSPPPVSKASDTLINPGNGNANHTPKMFVKPLGRFEEINGDDVDSNVQEGVRSEVGDPVPLHEPGPDDPPGPKYESYDSGPSFGNFGPLPTDDPRPAFSPRGSWNPDWTDMMGNGVNLNAAGVEGGALNRPSLVNSHQTFANMMNTTTPPRVQTKLSSENRPLSPLSGRSKQSRASEKRIPDNKMSAEITNDQVPSSPSISRVRPSLESASPRIELFASKPQYANGSARSPPGSPLSANQSRPFSSYRHAPTQEDLLNAAVRGRSLVIPLVPEEQELPPSKPPSKIASPQSRAMSQMEGGKPPSTAGSRGSRASRAQEDISHTPRPQSPEGMLDPEESRIINDALAVRTPRSSQYTAPLEPDTMSHFHDLELCILLQKEKDPSQHEYVKKALRKAVKQRIKKLGMKYDHESIKQYRNSYHDHDPSVHLRNGQESSDPLDPPRWAADIKRELVLVQQRIESLVPKIEGMKGTDRSFNAADGSRFAYEPDESTRTPMTQTVNIQTQPTGTMADSMYQNPENEIVIDDDGNMRDFDDMTETQDQGHPRHTRTDGETRSAAGSAYGLSEQERDDSPGQQVLEEQLYKLRQRTQGSQLSHKSWEVAPHEDDAYDENADLPPSGLPTIPDMHIEAYPEEGERPTSPPLPDLPEEARQDYAVPQGPWNAVDYSPEDKQLTPWQRIHSKLLSWGIIWPMIELDRALNSTTRGQQVDEVALSIWSTQAYKRYVRVRLTDRPQGVVDRLFVPPNLADAISTAVFNGRHGDACSFLKELWAPFGLEGMPRLIVVLAKHRSDPNHWVVHRFSLPDGTLTTYDSYPERTLPDGRPLGWWFSIRVAWPNTMYPSPDNLVQKMVRLHRPLQLPIDNSVAAAGIWRNVLMGSRAERSVDLERLRDHINTEVKNMKQRKQLGKLSIQSPRPAWDEMN